MGDQNILIKLQSSKTRESETSKLKKKV